MIQGWCLSPARIHVQGACGSWIVLPCVPAARPLRVPGDRLRRQDDEPRPARTCVQRCQCHCGLEDPVGGMSARAWEPSSAVHKGAYGVIRTSVPRCVLRLGFQACNGTAAALTVRGH